METPILVAVVGALAKLAEPVVKDAYEALKALFKRKTGDQSLVVKAVENLEADPSSKGRKLTLEEDLAKAGLDRDEEVLRAAQALLEKLGGHAAGGVTVTQTVTGSGNIFSGTGDVTVHKK